MSTPELIAGRYRVQRPVGRGGMGTVWLCHDEVLGRDVAVKQVGLLPGENAPDAARGLREARSAAGLNHENVVSVFDIVETDERIWLVMEYVPSRTLRQVLQEDGPLSPERAAAVGAQVADGLAAAHERGTVHRDVKPGNILVGESGVAKISDFGIARMAGEEQLTQIGMVTGTPSYFSPELARGQEAGPASDVWALGATLYAAVEGAAPYPEQSNALATLQTIVEKDPPPPEHAGPLAGAITSMMARDPGTRWSMAQAARALHALANGPAEESTALMTAPVAAAPPSWDDDAVTAPAAAVPVEPAPEERRRRGAVLAATALALLLLVGGVAYAMMGGDPGDSGDDDSPPAAARNTTKPSPSTTPEPSATPSPKPKPKPKPTPSPSSQAPEPQPKPVSAGGPDRMEDTVEEYFSAVPDDTDTGWSMLAPSMQAQGRDAYEGWWGSIDSVDLGEARANPGSDAVDVVLTYHFEDGRVVTENQRLYLERSGERFLIADDEVLSSRSG